jgi:hypothetical protein
MFHLVISLSDPIVTQKKIYLNDQSRFIKSILLINKLSIVHKDSPKWHFWLF